MAPVVGLPVRVSPHARLAVERGLRAAAARLPDLFAPGTRLVVGFSGGQDSTCLVHALAHSRLGLDVVAAHVDHGLRADSAEAARAVAQAGAAMGVSVAIHRVDLATYHRRLPGWSVQQAARAARYQVLAAVAQKTQAAAVLVAHTADDQAETLLINLLRGTGLVGLAGMRMDERIDLRRLGPALMLPEGDAHAAHAPEVMRLTRPLLSTSRATTLAYCTEVGLVLVEDPSNQSRTYTRNRVRLDLLPALERYNPAIRAVLARTADLAAEDVALLDALVDEVHLRLARNPAPELVEYDLRLWQAQPRGLQRRLLRRGLESLVGGLVDVRAAPIEDALDVLHAGTAARTYHLPYGVELCLRAESFVLRLHGRARSRTRSNTWDVEAPRV
ncbi:MAG: tRNA lysidine(34) synthetase TilS [Chloroflexi bacterium]|nr:tRNA lysidine(34) synthetase TilS [Chloroflexota bacterium]